MNQFFQNSHSYHLFFFICSIYDVSIIYEKNIQVLDFANKSIENEKFNNKKNHKVQLN